MPETPEGVQGKAGLGGSLDPGELQGGFHRPVRPRLRGKCARVRPGPVGLGCRMVFHSDGEQRDASSKKTEQFSPLTSLLLFSCKIFSSNGLTSDSVLSIKCHRIINSTQVLWAYDQTVSWDPFLQLFSVFCLSIHLFNKYLPSSYCPRSTIRQQNTQIGKTWPSLTGSRVQQGTEMKISSLNAHP